MYFDYADDEDDEDDGSRCHVPVDYSDKVLDFATFSDWLSYALAQNIPYGYALAFWSESRRDTTATILAPEESDVYLRRIGHELRDYDWVDDDTSFVISGPTGIGKTSWCKHWAPKPALLVSHIDALRQFVPGYHKSIIFDDMSFCHLPLQAQIHLSDCYDTRQIHMRHRVTQIPAHTKKFFSINPPDRVFLPVPAIERRTTMIEI